MAIKEITDRINPAEIEFQMVTLRFDSCLPKTEKVGNVLVHRIGLGKKDAQIQDFKKLPFYLNKPYYQLAAAVKALRLHKKYRFDGIWAMMAHSSGVPAAIFKIAQPSVGYALTLQEGDPIDYIERKMRPLWPLFSRAFKKADVIQPISSFLAQWARRRGFTGPLPIIPNGFSRQYFSQAPAPAEIEALKKKLGKKPGDIYLLTVSRLVPKNGLDDVIRAMPKLPANVYFIVVGGGPEEKNLKNLAQELGLSERVKFIGHVDRGQTAMFRRLADIFIRPSRTEGLGNSFITSMAARLPVIATQVGGLADFLFDAKRNPGKPTTGWAVDPNSPEQIAAAVKDILARPEQVKKVVANAYQLVFKKYNWDFIAPKIKEQVFFKICR